MVRDHSLSHCVQTGSEVRPDSCLMDSEGRAFSLEVKRPDREATNSHPSGVRVKNKWVLSLFFRRSSWRGD